MDELKCSKCGLFKNKTEFNKKGQSGYHCWCKSCANAHAKKWYQENKEKAHVSKRLKEYNKIKRTAIQVAVFELKSELGCCLCDEREPICLDFHHKEGKKDKNVSHFVQTKAVKRLINEITKCVCVCSNCHRKIHGKILVCPDIMLTKEFVFERLKHFLKKSRTIKLKQKKEKSKKIANRIYQRKVVWPEKELLESMVWETPLIQIAQKYGVTDKAVAGWCKKYNIKKPPIGYWLKK